MEEMTRLPLCYLDGVRKAIKDGRWKAKLDPVAFIRKAGRSSTFQVLTTMKIRRSIGPVSQTLPSWIRESGKFYGRSLVVTAGSR
jgi:hypothetical protein